MPKPVLIRELQADDLSAIVDIEERTTGTARRAYWEERIKISEAIRPHWASLVAEVNNRVAGFVFGRAGEKEFGLPGSIAWVEIIGVDPAVRRQGVAAKLIEHFTEAAGNHGIEMVFTLVGKGDAEMAKFFGKHGFAQGEMVHFQKKVKG